MEPEEYDIMFRVEDTHWWYAGMQHITRSLLERWYRRGGDLRILDAGCGTGAAMSSYLRDYGTVAGIDFSALALQYCQRRKAERLARASVTDLPFASESFDLVTSFDVLYERGVASDRRAAADICRVLRPGGRVLLRLAAYDWLRGRHDISVHTARRYTSGRMIDLLRSAGFLVEQVSYANTFLFPLAVSKRLMEHLQPDSRGSDLEADMGILNGVLRRILAAEAPFVSRGALPFGLSVVAVGRKPS